MQTALMILGLCIGVVFIAMSIFGNKMPKINSNEGDGNHSGILSIITKNVIRAKLIYSILLGIASIILLYWAYDTDTALKEISWLSHNHWLFLLIIWGILATLILVYATALGPLAKTLQWVLAILILAVLFGTQTAESLIGNGNTRQTTQRQSAEQPVLSMPASGDSRHVNSPPGHYTIFTGSGFTVHCVYTDGHTGIVGDKKHPCSDGPMLYQYVRDTTGRANAVTYAFARP